MVLVTGCRVLVNMIMIITYSRTSRSWGSSLTGHTLDRQKKNKNKPFISLSMTTF